MWSLETPHCQLPWRGEWPTTPRRTDRQAVVEPESSPGQLVGEAFRILLTRLTGDMASKITEDHDRGEGWCGVLINFTVDFIKQDLVSPVYKTLAYVAGIQKGRECVRSAKNGQGNFFFSLLPHTRAPKFPFPSCLKNLSRRLTSYLYTVFYYSTDLISPECNIFSFVSWM